MATPIEQLDAMRGLAPNWDGYNADPPVPAVLDRAKELAAAFAARFPGRPLLVYPARTGGVQLEWAAAGSEHELELNPDGSMGLLHVDTATGAMREERFPPGEAADPAVLFRAPSEPGASATG